ncbi:putative phage abortive infection protein [Pedobacter ureilyticus]|uniref:Phage abortive infection protein n=1 Tax=Pedobacter ureilyticus TaxID=1393051 RepID=A0ABW9JA09_9SPHI|nr:putative phage abortive infection protein [Pedobacter helvus]
MNTSGITIVVFLLCLVVIFCLPEWLYSQFPFYNYKDIGPIGDAIGGVAGPIVALVAAGLTFMAFKVQYDANQQQKIDLARERFENKFFEMLKLHKENLNEAYVEDYGSSKIVGRKIFETAYIELKACYKICEDVLSSIQLNDKRRYLTRMSYKLIYYGISNDLITYIDKNIKHDNEYLNKCRLAIEKYQFKHISTRGANIYYNIPGSSISVEISLKYKPFSGHYNAFSHYYRHLYMMSKYVTSQSDSVINEKEKSEYLRIIRSQLSTFEQLMLYFNYLSDLGENWENERNHFFSKYCLIKNIPISLAKFAVDPLEEFKELIEKCKINGKRMLNDSKY